MTEDLRMTLRASRQVDVLVQVMVLPGEGGDWVHLVADGELFDRIGPFAEPGAARRAADDCVSMLVDAGFAHELTHLN